jgi:hypothetical protein
MTTNNSLGHPGERRVVVLKGNRIVVRRGEPAIARPSHSFYILGPEAHLGFNLGELALISIGNATKSSGPTMNEKPESEEFDDDEDESIESEDLDLDQLIDTFDKRKKTGPKPGEPAWRRLERYREDRETAALLSDIDDYDIGNGDIGNRVAMKRRRKL